MNKPSFFTAMLFMGVMISPIAHAQNATSSVNLTNYQDRASVELRQLRAELDATVQETPLAGQPGLAPARNALSLAEQSLADFKIAPEIELSRKQIEFETAKEKARSLWNDYRSTHRAADSELTPMASRAVESME